MEPLLHVAPPTSGSRSRFNRIKVKLVSKHLKVKVRLLPIAPKGWVKLISNIFKFKVKLVSKVTAKLLSKG